MKGKDSIISIGGPWSIEENKQCKGFGGLRDYLRSEKSDSL